MFLAEGLSISAVVPVCILLVDFDKLVNGQTERGVLRAAWSQLKTKATLATRNILGCLDGQHQIVKTLEVSAPTNGGVCALKPTS